jgi:Protein of unknown function (DUF4242)
MPIFLDSHLGTELPLEVIRSFLRAARGGITDDFGVTPLDLYCGDDGRVFCVISAPDEAAVRQRHAAQGVVCRRVRRVQSLGAASLDLSAEEKAVVRQMIAAEQEVPAITAVAELTEDDWLRQVG